LEKDKNDYKITGLEEFYVELSMRPKEAEEEELLYDFKLSVATYLPPCGTTL